MNPLFKPKLIAGNSNRPLATAIARRISMHRGETVELVKTRVERFNDAEIFVEVYENVRGEDMFIIQSTSNPANDNLMELLIMCRRAAPVLGAPDHRGDALFRLCPAGPPLEGAHADQRQAGGEPADRRRDRAGADDGPARGADPGLLRHPGRQPLRRAGLRARHPRTSSATSPRSPSSRPTSAAWRGRASWPSGSTPTSPSSTSAGPAPGEVASMTVIGEVRDRVCVIVDDICDTAGTLVKAAELLISAGRHARCTPTSPTACCRRRRSSGSQARR